MCNQHKFTYFKETIIYKMYKVDHLLMVLYVPEELVSGTSKSGHTECQKSLYLKLLQRLTGERHGENGADVSLCVLRVSLVELRSQQVLVVTSLSKDRQISHHLFSGAICRVLAVEAWPRGDLH